MKKTVTYCCILMVLLIASVLLSRLQRGERMLGISIKKVPNFSEGYEIGSWLWDSPVALDAQGRFKIFEFCKAEKINTLYVRIDDYIEISEIQNADLRKLSEKEFEKTIEIFLDTANSYGIKIHALAGGSNWSDLNLVYIPELLTDFVIKFNKANKGVRKFDGIQFDIEFYNQEGFEARKGELTVNYLDLISRLTDKVSSYNTKSRDNLRLGIVIPYWFDKADGYVPSIQWKNTTKPIGYQVIDVLNRLRGSYVAVMAYRDTARGKNGSVGISEDEVKYTEQFAPNVSIIIGQETEATNEKGTSYIGKGKATLKRAVADIMSDFMKYQTFKGVAIHTLTSYQQL